MSNLESIYFPNEGHIPKGMGERSVIVKFRNGTGGRFLAKSLRWSIMGSELDIVGWFPGSEDGPVAAIEQAWGASLASQAKIREAQSQINAQAREALDSCPDQPVVDAVTQFVVAQKLGYPAGVAVKALVDHAKNGGKDHAIRAAIKACRDILWIEYGVTE